MTVVANASVVFKDKNGNVGTVKGASANDITKISNAISDVAQVVNPTTHLPINATTSSVGVVQLADSTAVAAGTSGRVVDAAQLKAVSDAIPSTTNMVDLSSAQTITGVKTFSALPESSVVPTTDNQLVNKKYVDDHAVPTPADMMTTDTAQTVSAVKTFTSLPESSVAPTTANQLVNKTYADTKADIEVASTYTEPSAENGILSPATDLITAPSSQQTFEGRGVKTGVIEAFAGSQVPTGYLLCNGAAVSRTTYARLFAEIGTTYGTGDGSTTFNLPDMRDRYIIGANTNVLGTQVAEQLPNITGSLTDSSKETILGLASNRVTDNGALYHNGVNVGSSYTTGVNGSFDIYFDASRSNSVYTDSGKVYPLSLALNFIIKAQALMIKFNANDSGYTFPLSVQTLFEFEALKGIFIRVPELPPVQK